MIDIAEKFLKFGAVGASGMLVDFACTYLCKERWGINKYIANSVGFAAAATSNYWLNRTWSFRSTNPDILMEYTAFVGVATVGLVINNAVLYIANERYRIHFYLSKLIAIGVTTIWNFTINFLFVF